MSQQEGPAPASSSLEGRLLAHWKAVSTADAPLQPAQVVELSARQVGLVLDRQLPPDSALIIALTDRSGSCRCARGARVVRSTETQRGIVVHCQFNSHLCSLEILTLSK